MLAFSSNYALYGDICERVMSVIESVVPAVEVYSVDEAFADLTGMIPLTRQGEASVRRFTSTSVSPSGSVAPVP